MIAYIQIETVFIDEYSETQHVFLLFIVEHKISFRKLLN